MIHHNESSGSFYYDFIRKGKRYTGVCTGCKTRRDRRERRRAGKEGSGPPPCLHLHAVARHRRHERLRGVLRVDVFLSCITADVLGG